MYDILIVSHGSLAYGYYNTMKMILGDEPEIFYCSLDEKDSNEDLDKKIRNSVDWNSCKEVLILVDVYSGSPCRSAITQLLSSAKKGYIVAGVNLPLVMEAYTNRTKELKEIVKTLIQVAKENVINVSENFMNEMNTEDE